MTNPTTPPRRASEAPQHTEVLRGSPVLVVLSGGQDSTTCLFWARQQAQFAGAPLYAMVVNYGQRHQRELDAARIVANRAGCNTAPNDFFRVDVPDVLRSRSPLTDPSILLEQYADAASMAATIGNRVELTFVPMRNPFFLTLAANLAVSLNCFDIVTGVCEEDNANYPDCRLQYVLAQESAINTALGLQEGMFKIHTPLMHYSKAETVQLATALPGAYSALAYSHTAYDGAYPPLGHDHATLLRADGFEKAGLPDPLVLRAVTAGFMPLPTTDNYSKAALQYGAEYLRMDEDAGHHSPWLSSFLLNVMP